MNKQTGGVVSAPPKNLRRRLSGKGLVKGNEILQNHKNTSFDNLKQFSVSYSTIWNDSYGKLEEIATHSQWEGSRKQKYKMSL